MSIETKSDQVESVLLSALCQSAVEAGARLRSERDLALLFGVGRRQVNQALNELVRRGILIRRWGSGTFLRKVPELLREEQFHDWRDLGLNSPKDIFADDSQPSSDPVSIHRARQLQIGLWGDWHLLRQDSHLASQRGILARLERNNHVLKVHSVVQAKNTPLDHEELRRRIELHPCDGYLVVARWASQFKQAMGDRPLPVVYCGAGRLIEHEPAVVIDPSAATFRGMRILAAEGYRRVGMLAAYGSAEFHQQRMKIYTRAMEDAGLDYRATELMPSAEYNGYAMARRILERPDPPDALFVADQDLVPALAEVLAYKQLVPGRDIGVICVVNRGFSPLPNENWSRFEIEGDRVGWLAADSLLRLIEQSVHPLDNLVVQPKWVPGNTHHRESAMPSSCRLLRTR